MTRLPTYSSRSCYLLFVLLSLFPPPQVLEGMPTSLLMPEPDLVPEVLVTAVPAKPPEGREGSKEPSTVRDDPPMPDPVDPVRARSQSADPAERSESDAEGTGAQPMAERSGRRYRKRQREGSYRGRSGSESGHGMDSASESGDSDYEPELVPDAVAPTEDAAMPDAASADAPSADAPLRPVEPTTSCTLKVRSMVVRLCSCLFMLLCCNLWCAVMLCSCCVVSIFVVLRRVQSILSSWCCCCFVVCCVALCCAAWCGVVCCWPLHYPLVALP